MNKFDPRIDALVMETRTHWDSSVGTLSDEDRRWVAKSIHGIDTVAGYLPG